MPRESCETGEEGGGDAFYDITYSITKYFWLVTPLSRSTTEYYDYGYGYGNAAIKITPLAECQELPRRRADNSPRNTVFCLEVYSVEKNVKLW